MLAAAVADALVGLGQMGPPPGAPGPTWDVNPVATVVGNAIGNFVLTLVVGAIMVAVAPEYTDSKIETVLDEPVGSFLYGILLLIGLLFATVLLVITIVGILVAIPLLLAAVVIFAIGSAIAFLAIGERLVGREDGWLKPLAVGAALNGGLALTGVGGLVSLCIAAAGFGAILRDRL